VSVVIVFFFFFVFSFSISFLFSEYLTNNNHVKTLLFLENITLKDSFERESFYKNLPKILEDLPPKCKSLKILPALLGTVELARLVVVVVVVVLLLLLLLLLLSPSSSSSSSSSSSFCRQNAKV